MRLLLAGLTLLLLIPQLDAAVRLPSANRECATCHIMWLTEFKQKDANTLVPYEPRPVMNTGKQDVASNEALCFSCHDGFVLDSRFMWEKGKYAHPVGQKPSEKIHIPRENGKNIFPLNDDGKVYCGTCHSAHGVDWADKDAPLFMRVRDVDGKLCMSCHKDKTEGPGHGMHPVNKALDKAPKKLKQAGAKFGQKGEVVCQSCHRPHGAPEEKFLLVKNDKSQLCGTCHDDRYALSTSQAGHMGTHPVNIKPQQVKIPASLKEAGAKFGGKGEIICQSCHKPHAAKGEQGLLLADNDQGAMCQSCHEKQSSVLKGKHDMSLAEKSSQNIRKQSPEDAGTCSACHVPHKGTGPKMWARPRDKNQDPMASLCLSCHDKNGLADKHTVGEHSHPVGVKISKLDRAVPLPTFSDSGVKWVDVEQGKVSCASCHDPHQWDPNDVHNQAQPGDKGDNTNRFLRIANGAEAALCKTCHRDKWNVANSKHDMRHMAPDAENALGQNVDESGICGACHLVHNAKGSRLWARSDLTGQGTGYVACLGCHNDKGLAKDKALGEHSHPLNVAVSNIGIQASDEKWTREHTQTANTDGNPIPLPLYDANGQPIAHDGRVGCGTCHDPHNWSTLNEPKTEDPEKLEGDSGNSFLRIADQGLSQLCVNCHAEKKSVYFSKHDLTEQLGKVSTQLKNEPNNKPQHLAGPCLHCHRPHNAKGPALSNRDPGPGKTAIAALCTDCHQEDGLAKNKLTGTHSHPLGVDASKLQADKRLPTFSAKGDRVENGQGLVDCASCHDPHRWDPNDEHNRGLPLLAEEGDTSNSFLRLTANNNSELCLACHKDKQTIIGTDHDLKHTVPSASNNLQQEQDVSGLCGQCHVPHNSETAAYIWARETGTGADPIEQRCRSCHNPLGYAAHKNPQQAQHPQQVKIWSTDIRETIRPDTKLPDMPVFDEQGKRNNFGAITCASCHNPHQWNSQNKKQGTGKNPEGDARSSFLRAGDSGNIVCAECHGEDGIYRYKYFHSDSAHKKHHMFK